MAVRYLRNSQTEPTTGGDYYDMLPEQGATAAGVQFSFNDTTFVEAGRFIRQLSDAPNGSSFPSSVNVTAIDGTIEFRFRLERWTSAGVFIEAGTYSALYTTTGIKTETLSFAPSAWNTGDLLMLTMEGRRTGGHGTVRFTVSTQDADSYVDVPLPTPPIVLEANAGSLSLTGQAATLLRDRVLDAQAGALALAGQDADLSRILAPLEAQAGALSLVGQNATLSVVSPPPDPVILSESTNIAAGGTTETTQQLTAGSGTFAAGRISDDTNPVTSTIPADGYTEHEWAIEFSSEAEASATYEFAVFVDGEQLTGTPAELSVLSGAVLQAEAGALSIEGQAAAFLRDRILAAEPGALSLAGQNANLSVVTEAPAHPVSWGIKAWGGPIPWGAAAVGEVPTPLVMEVQPGVLSIEGQAATLLRDRILSADPGTVSLAGQSAILLRNRILSADPGALALSGQDANLLRALLLSGDPGALSLAGQDAALLRLLTLSGDPGAIALAGQGANLLRSRLLTGDPGALALAGQDATFFRNYVLSADAGSVLLTGQEATLTVVGSGIIVLEAQAGSLSLTGQSAVFLRDRIMRVDPGALSVVGQEAALLWNRLLLAGAGDLSLEGQEALLARIRFLSADAGAVALTGQDANLLRNRILSASNGDLLLTGQNANLLRDRILLAEAGAISLEGMEAIFRLSGQPQPVRGALWVSPRVLGEIALREAVRGSMGVAAKVDGDSDVNPED